MVLSLRLAAALLLVLACFARSAVAQVDLNGVHIGTHDRAALFRIHPNAVCIFSGMPPRDEQCVVRAAYLGVPAQIMYVLLDGKVAGASAAFPAASFDNILAVLTNRYSNPTVVDGGRLPDRSDIVAQWQVAGISILAFRYQRDAGDRTSMVIYETPAARQHMSQRFGGARETTAKAIQDLAARLLPEAEGARLSVFTDSSRDAYQVSHLVDVALKDITKLSGSNISAIRSRLALLERSIGPLRMFPHYELHGLLAAIAAAEGNAEDALYHEAFRHALLQALERTGDGRTPGSAFKVVSVREEYVWFRTQQHRLKQKSQALVQIGERMYDVWTAINSAGAEEQVYFDVTALFESKRRWEALRK